jgi:hypothetical protein
MTRTEEACRWSIVEAYVVWHLARREAPKRLLNLAAYERALGLEPTWPEG